MDDVEVTLLLHVAGDYDPALGQLCMRCAVVLLPSAANRGLLAQARCCPAFPPGATVAVVAGALRLLESDLEPERDRSDEAECLSILDEDDHLCSCGHALDVHKFPEEPGGAACWSCDCVAYDPDPEMEG